MPRTLTVNPFAGFFGRNRTEPLRPFRRLQGERLEGRMVLSTAPMPVETPQGQSLAEYLEQQHTMGPVAPAEVAAAPETDAIHDAQQTVTTVGPDAVDQWFGSGYGQGEGEGSGSGSGSGAGSGSGSGAGSGSGSGAGSSSGSGSGSGGGSSSGSGDPEDPTLSDTSTESGTGTMTITGQINDDGGLEGVSVTLNGAEGSVTIDSNGVFTVDVTGLEGNGSFTITVTDANGNSTTYTFDY